MSLTSEAPGLFQGVYNYTEAARLVGVTVQRLARWADGYTYTLKSGEYAASAPILQTARKKYKGVLSFRELIELFFVREYSALRVALPEIRRTAEHLAQVLGPYPFVRANLIVSGRELLIKTAHDLLERPAVGQLVADFGEAFQHRVAFRDDMVAQYRPPGYGEKILLDKQIRGGEPIVSEYGVPTRAIYALWEREQMLEPLAEYYELDLRDVSVAVRYESEWRLAA